MPASPSAALLAPEVLPPFVAPPAPRVPALIPPRPERRTRLADERLALVAGVDDGAFGELHGRHDPGLKRFALGMLRDPHDAADAVQDTWARALTALREPPIRVLSVRAWLYAIARNACTDRLREAARRSPAELDESMLGAAPAPDEMLDLRDRAREALRDLAGLSERQRAALLLREVAGLEGEDFARALGIDERRASWLLTDARRSLGELRVGRGLSCEDTRAHLEHARVRTRAVRAHLDACEECGAFARRRVGARVHLHAFGLIAAALPLRLRALADRALVALPLPGSGGGALRPAAALAAAGIAAVTIANPPHAARHHGAKPATTVAIAAAPRESVALPSPPPVRTARPTATIGDRRLVVRTPVAAERHVPAARETPPIAAPLAAPVTPGASAPVDAVPAPVRHALAPVTGQVAGTTKRVLAAVSKAAPAAAPATDQVAQVVDRVMRGLGG